LLYIKGKNIRPGLLSPKDNPDLDGPKFVLDECQITCEKGGVDLKVLVYLALKA